MPVSTGASAAHPALAGYAQRHGLSLGAFRTDGRLTLRFDRRHRLQIRPAANGRIAFAARLMDLSARALDVEQTLLHLAAMGAGLLRDHAAGLCVDEAEQTVVLQQVLPSDADVALLESELAAFVNTLAFWMHACAFARLVRPA